MFADVSTGGMNESCVTFKNEVMSSEGTPDEGELRSGVGVIKHSTVSTIHLKASLPLQLWPINLVVYQGSLALRHGNFISRGASRLDAFSGYPCQT